MQRSSRRKIDSWRIANGHQRVSACCRNLHERLAVLAIPFAIRHLSVDSRGAGVADSFCAILTIQLLFIADNRRYRYFPVVAIVASVSLLRAFFATLRPEASRGIQRPCKAQWGGTGDAAAESGWTRRRSGGKGLRSDDHGKERDCSGALFGCSRAFQGRSLTIRDRLAAPSWSSAADSGQARLCLSSLSQGTEPDWTSRHAKQNYGKKTATKATHAAMEASSIGSSVRTDLASTSAGATIYGSGNSPTTRALAMAKARADPCFVRPADASPGAPTKADLALTATP
eukprot:scaffold1405_cov225-Pinguiococcus_pyrenoidosus.AAC.2